MAFDSSILSRPLDELSYNERLNRKWYEGGQTPYTNQAGIKTNIGYTDTGTYGADTGWLRDYFGNQGQGVPVGLSSGNIADLRREYTRQPAMQEQAQTQAPQMTAPNPFQYMGQNPYQSGTAQYDNYMNAQSSAFNAPWMQTAQFQNPIAYQGGSQISPNETRQIGYGAGAYNVPFSQFMQNPQYYNQQSAAMSPQYNPFMQYQQSGFGGGFGNFMQQTGRDPYGFYSQQPNPWRGGGYSGGYGQPQQPSFETKPALPKTNPWNPWMGGGNDVPPTVMNVMGNPLWDISYRKNPQTGKIERMSNFGAAGGIWFPVETSIPNPLMGGGGFMKPIGGYQLRPNPWSGGYSQPNKPRPMVYDSWNKQWVPEGTMVKR